MGLYFDRHIFRGIKLGAIFVAIWFIFFCNMVASIGRVGVQKNMGHLRNRPLYPKEQPWNELSWSSVAKHFRYLKWEVLTYLYNLYARLIWGKTHLKQMCFCVSCCVGKKKRPRFPWKPAKVSYNAALNVCASNAEVENLGLKKGFFSGWIFRDSLGTYGTPLLYGNSMGPSCHTGVPGITLEICKASPLIFFGSIFEPKKITQLKRNIWTKIRFLG